MDLENAMLEELDHLLSDFRNRVLLLNAGNENLNSSITNQLSSIGIALVLIDHVQAQEVNVATGSIMADTFVHLSDSTKRSLHLGQFGMFSKEWTSSKPGYSVTQIAFKTNGMANKPPLTPTLRKSFTCPYTKTIHIDNSLNAINSISLWERLSMLNAKLHPQQWFITPLKPENHRSQVSEDGIKILVKTKYLPTAIHYDGKLGQGETADTQRIQIVYSSDQGPVRLFAIPGSQHPRVRELIQHITKTVGITGFTTLKKEFDEHQKLRNLLYKYGVALPSTGLLMFRANVWHYEAVEDLTPVNRDRPVYVRLNVNEEYDENDTASKTVTSSVFRIYCGIISAPPGLTKDLIVLAFLRENGWSMDPFSSANKNHPFFVNGKSGSMGLWKVATSPSQLAFDALVGRGLEQIKDFLLSNVLPNRLALYGITVDDLAPVSPVMPVVATYDDGLQQEPHFIEDLKTQTQEAGSSNISRKRTYSAKNELNAH
ncbi:hypothetical protein HK096_005807, partial [Nowakowskiella sp. JEL0078]